MSLLLEALKKAELAKQQGTATQPPEAPATADPGSAGLALEPASAEVSSERPLITRDRLPDITQPLEILSEDLPSAGVRRETPPASAATGLADGSAAAGGAGPAPAERAVRTPAEPEPEEQDRLSARQLFEAKESDYNPRRPFFIAMGALGLAAAAVVGYFLYQIYAPRPSFYTGPATKPAPIATASTPPAPPAAPAATAATAGTPPAAAPATAVASAPQPAPSNGTTRSSAPAAGPAPRAPRAAAGPPPDTDPAPRAAAPVAQAAPIIRVSRPEPRVEPGLERAWRALESGNLALAKEEYLKVLGANPLDRDALLGLATIDVRTQDFDSAAARYFRVLELDPRDPYAQAGIIALRGQADPLQSESRLKNLLAQYPDSALLNYALGNLYSVQARWSDAQAAYFKAYSGDTENADYAYNLAVSLDQLHQPKLALEYYRRALALAANRAVGFNSAQVEARVRELAR
jgi:Tfp pilus assembly protein PilF